MDNVEISVAIITAILGIAYPILLEVVSRLDEKYSSQVILGIFETEGPRKYFTKLLVAAVIAVGIYMLKLPVIPAVKDYFHDNTFLISAIEHSAEIIMSGVVAVLVFNFFVLVRKIFVYYTPSKFINYLYKIFTTRNNRDDYTHFTAMSDVLYLAVRKRDYRMAKSISDKFYPEFRLIRELSGNSPVEYPGAYYEMIREIMKEVIQSEDELWRIEVPGECGFLVNFLIQKYQIKLMVFYGTV